MTILDAIVKETKVGLKKAMITAGKVILYSTLGVLLLFGILTVALKSDGGETYDVNLTQTQK